jgi:hypothetical protein
MRTIIFSPMEVKMTADVERIGVSAARAKIAQGKALLVCGYEDDTKCRKGRLEGSIPFARFASMAQTLPKNQEIIFYCA